jgi:hypothetical protein
MTVFDVPRFQRRRRPHPDSAQYDVEGAHFCPKGIAAELAILLARSS